MEKAPRKVLELAIYNRKDQIRELEKSMELQVAELCHTREKLVKAKTDLYQLEQAVSQLLD